MAVNGTEVSVLVCPFIPDGNAVVRQVLDVGIALKEPKKLVDDGFKVDFLGRKQREAVVEVEPHLITEYADRPGSCPVALPHATFLDVAQHFQILFHGSQNYF
jgi:hypothetical protein